METPIEFTPVPPTNKHSIISLIFGILTVLTLCGTMLPLPLTGFICFPASFISGIVALTYGIISLNRLRASDESGRPMAWAGIVIGGFIILCFLCVLGILIYFFTYHPDSIHLPPIFDKYNI